MPGILRRSEFWSSRQTHSTLAKLGILIKIYLFSWNIKCTFLVCACFLGKWWRSFLSLKNWQAGIYSGLVNRGVLLKNLTFWELDLFWTFFMHMDNWIPGRINLFISLIKWHGKNSLLWEKSFHQKQVSRCKFLNLINCFERFSLKEVCYLTLRSTCLFISFNGCTDQHCVGFIFNFWEKVT